MKKMMIGALILTAVLANSQVFAASYVGDTATYLNFLRGRVPSQFIEKHTILAYDSAQGVFKEEIIETSVDGSEISRRIQNSAYYGAEAGAQKYYYFDCQKNTNGSIAPVPVPAGSLLACNYSVNSPYSNDAFISFGQVPFGTIRYQEANGNFTRELISYKFGQR